MRVRFFASMRRNVPVFAFYFVLAALITWPLVTVMGTHFAGYADGDAHEMARHIWWIQHALSTGQPVFFQPLLGYPDGLEGVILWSNPLQFFPAWLFAFIMPPTAAYNLSALLALALNGWAACFLARGLTGSRPAALVAGVVFMAAPTMQGHLAGGHGGLLVQWPLPLLAYALLRLREQASDTGRQLPPNNRKPETGNRQLAVILFFVLLPLGHTLQLIYAGLPLVGLFALTLLAERNIPALRQLALAAGAGGAILLVFLLPVAAATLGTSAYTGEGGGVTYSIDLLAAVTPSFNHPLFGQFAFTHRVLGTNIVEGSSCVGFAAGLLALVAVWKRRESRGWLVVALVAWGLALGPLLKLFDAPVSLVADGYETHVALPWALVQDWPVFNLARTPGRFNFLLALAVSVLAGYGAQIALRGQTTPPLNPLPIKWRGDSKTLFYSVLTPSLARGWGVRIITAVLVALILFEYQSFWPLPTYPAEVPAAVRALAARQDVRAVFDLPWDNVLAAKDALWLQTAHQKPLIAGQVSRRTPVNPAKLSVLQNTLDAALLDAAGVDVVIVHKGYDAALAVRVRERLGAPFYEDDRLALYEIPAPDAPPGFTAVPVEAAAITDRLDFYLHAPESGWVTVETSLVGGQPVVILLEGQPVQRIAPDGQPQSLVLRLPLAAPGYHTLALALETPCPPHIPETLVCNGARVSGLQASDYTPAAMPAVQFEGGLTLAGSLVQPARGSVSVGLWWRFDQPRTDLDVRFVKVLDENGQQVAGVDETLGSRAAGEQWVENITLDLPDDLPPGDYGVYAGWYAYPDLTRFAVLADTPRAQEGLAYLGELAAQ
ncbi:MAG: hypothetical protein DWB42_09835 [Chloroflexi bacterium]|nr:hypothetical protein [Chloroflexota bacterium]MDL1883131.1 hypothetical protein [Anaerolineae bacterium CFX8]